MQGYLNLQIKVCFQCRLEIRIEDIMHLTEPKESRKLQA